METGLLKCRLLMISDTHATVVVPGDTKLPRALNLYFTSDGQIGRKCRLKAQTGDLADLAIIGRIESQAEGA